MDEVPEDSNVVKSDMNEDLEEDMKLKDNSGKDTHTTHAFHITQADIGRHGASVRFNGCQYVLGRIPYQVAHTIDCRKRIVNVMRDNLQDRLSVQKWDEDHGISEKGTTA